MARPKTFFQIVFTPSTFLPLPDIVCHLFITLSAIAAALKVLVALVRIAAFGCRS